jgi:phosphatidylglycerol lysyltransferase
MCFLAVIWVAGLGTGSIADGPPRWLSSHIGAGLPSLGHGFWWTPLAAGLWASGLGSYLVVTAAGLLILAPAERRLGAIRTFVTLLVSQAGGFLVAAALIKLAWLAHQPWPGVLTGETAIGALPGLVGVAFALSRTLTPRWRTRLRLVLTVAITTGVMYVGHLEQVAVACGAVGSLVALALTSDRGWSWAERRVSRHEVRVLVATLVAVPALGVLLVALLATQNDPASLSSLMFATTRPRARVHVAPALLVLLCAYGLHRGRRLAWWLAVVINLTVLAVSIWAAYAAGAHPSVRASRLEILLPVLTLTVLLVTRGSFDQTAERRVATKLMTVLATASSASFVAFVLFDYPQRDGSGAPARDLPMRFVAYLLFGNRGLPARVSFWTVVLGALTAFFLHTRAYRDVDAAEQARAVLARGGSTLSYMSTWRGNEYWISADGRAAVAYRPIAGVAVTVGEPYGDPAALDCAITEFASFCEHRGLQPCLYSVTAQTRAVTQRLGWRSVQIAEDTLVPLAHLQFAGKKWQNVRNAVNKAARDGITAEWWSYADAPPELVRQIRQISGKWMADKGLPEMGFTLGGLEELKDRNIRCLIAVGADRKVHAVTSWMPVYENGRPVGWTLDLMRRNTGPGTSHGVMEFLIATAAKTFRDEGARFISLSGAPLARLDRGEQPCAVRRLLDVVANVMEPLYGFQSLLQFKGKFHPEYQPLYVTYPDPAAIGSIATAIGRAYLPNLTSRQALRLLTRLHRPRLQITGS